MGVAARTEILYQHVDPDGDTFNIYSTGMVEIVDAETEAVAQVSASIETARAMATAAFALVNQATPLAERVGLPEVVKPRVDERGVPWCSEGACPSYDGKRCALTGFQPRGVCEPAVISLVRQQPAISKADESCADVLEILGVDHLPLADAARILGERLIQALDKRAQAKADTPADDLTWRPWASAPAGRVIAVAWIDDEERRLDGPNLAKVWDDGEWRCLPYSDVMSGRLLPTHWAPIPADPYATAGSCTAAEATGG